MIIKLLKFFYHYLFEIIDKLHIKFLWYIEIKKFKDSRRVKIFSKIQLTKEQKKQIDEFYLKNYGKKIPYTWHRHYTAFTGNFDVKYFPELLYIPCFEKFINYKYRYSTAFSDKNIVPHLAKSINLLMPHSYVSCIEGLFIDEKNNKISKRQAIKMLSNIGKVFIKPTTRSDSGKGCAIIDIHNEEDLITGKQVETIISSIGDNFVIQECLICHETISTLYPHSVNTFRIITYRWKSEIYHMPIIMRIGQGGSNIDNAHAGGMFIAVDDDGTLHKTAFTEFNKQYTEHPDTHIVFEGYKIPCMNKIITAAKEMHSLIPQLGCYNWDFTIDKLGNPVLLEINVMGGSIWMLQMAHGKGAFGDRTEEVLKWISKMEKLSYFERQFYKYGCMENKN